ncbi:MAG: hypothetical protein QXI95_02455 [Candidatus Micrarchaeaceae archaeon]
MSWTVSNTVTEYYNPSEWTHLIGNGLPSTNLYNNSQMGSLYDIPITNLSSLNITYFNNNQIFSIPVTSTTILNSWYTSKSAWYFSSYNNYFFIYNVINLPPSLILTLYTLNSIPTELTDSLLESASSFSYIYPFSTQTTTYLIEPFTPLFINGTNLYYYFGVTNLLTTTLYCLEITNFNTISNTISTSFSFSTDTTPIAYTIDSNFNIYLLFQNNNTYACTIEQQTINFSTFGFNSPTEIYSFSANNLLISGRGINNGVLYFGNNNQIQNYILNNSNSTIEIYSLANVPITVPMFKTYEISNKIVWEIPDYLITNNITQQNQYKVNYLPCYNFKYNKGRI